MARASSSEDDFDLYIAPLLPFICMTLNDEKKFEDSTKILMEMQESFIRFLSPTTDFDRISKQYDKLVSEGIYDIVISQVRRITNINEIIKKEKDNDKLGAVEDVGSALIPDDMKIDEYQIQSIGTGADQLPSDSTIHNLFRVLENGARYSSTVANKLFGAGQVSLLKHLATFLPHDHGGTKKQYESEDFPFIIATVNLLTTVLSGEGSSLTEPTVPLSLSSLFDGGDPILQKRQVSRQEYEK